jgi:hypothetical protein
MMIARITVHLKKERVRYGLEPVHVFRIPRLLIFLLTYPMQNYKISGCLIQRQITPPYIPVYPPTSCFA